jgi:hypothetical protein
MTEPDEALIWARERAKADWLECDDETGTLHAAAEDFPSGDSDHFEDIEWRAEAYRAGQAASAERIKALEEALEKANRPTHFWASTDGESGEICPEIESAIEPALYEAPRGRHLVEVEAWRRCQTIWAVVHLLTDEEQEALGVDTDWTITKCATEAEAEALLKEADHA